MLLLASESSAIQQSLRPAKQPTFEKSVADSHFPLSSFQRTDAFFRRELRSYDLTDRLSSPFLPAARLARICLVKEPARMGRRSTQGPRREARTVQPPWGPCQGPFRVPCSPAQGSSPQGASSGGCLRHIRGTGTSCKITFRQRPTLPHTGRVQYHRR